MHKGDHLERLDVTWIYLTPVFPARSNHRYDASSDFQGDAWHGAMTYTNFTRPLWGWLSEPLTDAGGLGMAMQTIPWNAVDAASDTIDLYAELIALKREHSALNGGGIRWVHVGADALAYVREDAAESLLVVAARADVDVALPLETVPTPDAVEPLFGSLDLAVGTDSIRISGSGPAFAVWRAAGVTAE